MKKTLIATAALAAVIALAGCSPSVVAAPAPVPTVTVTAEPPVPEQKDYTASPEVDAEQSYLTALYTEGYFVQVNDDALLLDTGYAICRAFDQGASVGEVVLSASENGIPGYEAGFLIGAAVAYFCPEYIPALEAFVNDNS